MSQIKKLSFLVMVLLDDKILRELPKDHPSKVLFNLAQ